MWANKWYDQYSGIFDLAAGSGILFSSVGLILVLVIKMVLANSSRTNQGLHGSARWADKKDIEAAGLLATGKSNHGDAVYVGGWRDNSGKTHYLKHSGPEHVLCYAPTRSGKGVSLVIPTLLSWAHSAVITDLKGELWALTSGWRKQHAKNKALRFDPASTSSAHWNPLDEIQIGSGMEVADVQNLTTLIVDPDGNKGLQTHWQKTSQALLVGVILHVLYKSEREGTPATLSAVDSMLSDPDRDIRELWMEMAMQNYLDGKSHPVIAASARDMLDRPEEEAGSVLSTAKSYLSLYRDPIVANNISTSDFTIRDLMHHDSPVSLYIVSHPNDKSRLRPLIRILINMIIRKLADRITFKGGQPSAHYKHKLLLMLDEFPSLGKLEIFQESLAFIAGYGIKAYPDSLVFTAGDLLLAAHDVHGQIWSVQTIQPSGTKLFAAGSKKENNFHVAGNAGQGLDAAINKLPAIVIAEGYATADTLSQALNYPVIAAFDSGNLPKVAQDLHHKYPHKPIIIAGDDDYHLESTLGKNPGKEKALEAAALVNGVAVFPVFAPSERDSKKLNDFNDLANKSALGIEAVKRQVGSVVEKVSQRAKQDSLLKLQALIEPKQQEIKQKRALVR